MQKERNGIELMSYEMRDEQRANVIQENRKRDRR